MTSYLEDDAEAIRQGLPAGFEVPPRSASLFLTYAVLLRAKGAATEASDVHDAWSAWMLTVDPEHPAIRPFANLDAETRREDAPFLRAIHAAASSLSR
jgi:hypothetical protein